MAEKMLRKYWLLALLTTVMGAGLAIVAVENNLWGLLTATVGGVVSVVLSMLFLSAKQFCLGNRAAINQVTDTFDDLVTVSEKDLGNFRAGVNEVKIASSELKSTSGALGNLIGSFEKDFSSREIIRHQDDVRKVLEDLRKLQDMILVTERKILRETLKRSELIGIKERASATERRVIGLLEDKFLSSNALLTEQLNLLSELKDTVGKPEGAQNVSERLE